MPILTKLFSMEEAAQHNTKDDCWVVIDGKVSRTSFPLFVVYVLKNCHEFRMRKKKEAKFMVSISSFFCWAYIDSVFGCLGKSASLVGHHGFLGVYIEGFCSWVCDYFHFSLSSRCSFECLKNENYS